MKGKEVTLKINFTRFVFGLCILLAFFAGAILGEIYAFLVWSILG